MFTGIRRLWRWVSEGRYSRSKRRADNRWWEDGWPVEVKPFTGTFQRALAIEYCKVEWEMTLDIHKQVWGE